MPPKKRREQYRAIRTAAAAEKLQTKLDAARRHLAAHTKLRMERDRDRLRKNPQRPLDSYEPNAVDRAVAEAAARVHDMEQILLDWQHAEGGGDEAMNEGEADTQDEPPSPKRQERAPSPEPRIYEAPSPEPAALKRSPSLSELSTPTTTTPYEKPDKRFRDRTKAVPRAVRKSEKTDELAWRLAMREAERDLAEKNIRASEAAAVQMPVLPPAPSPAAAAPLPPPPAAEKPAAAFGEEAARRAEAALQQAEQDRIAAQRRQEQLDAKERELDRRIDQAKQEIQQRDMLHERTLMHLEDSRSAERQERDRKLAAKAEKAADVLPPLPPNTSLAEMHHILDEDKKKASSEGVRRAIDAHKQQRNRVPLGRATPSPPPHARPPKPPPRLRSQAAPKSEEPERPLPAVPPPPPPASEVATPLPIVPASKEPGTLPPPRNIEEALERELLSVDEIRALERQMGVEKNELLERLNSLQKLRHAIDIKDYEKQFPTVPAWRHAGGPAKLPAPRPPAPGSGPRRPREIEPPPAEPQQPQWLPDEAEKDALLRSILEGPMGPVSIGVPDDQPEPPPRQATHELRRPLAPLGRQGDLERLALHASHAPRMPVKAELPVTPPPVPARPPRAEAPPPHAPAPPRDNTPPPGPTLGKLPTEKRAASRAPPTPPTPPPPPPEPDEASPTIEKREPRDEREENEHEAPLALDVLAPLKAVGRGLKSLWPSPPTTTTTKEEVVKREPLEAEAEPAHYPPDTSLPLQPDWVDAPLAPASAIAPAPRVPQRPPTRLERELRWGAANLKPTYTRVGELERARSIPLRGGPEPLPMGFSEREPSAPLDLNAYAPPRPAPSPPAAASEERPPPFPTTLPLQPDWINAPRPLAPPPAPQPPKKSKLAHDLQEARGNLIHVQRPLDGEARYRAELARLFEQNREALQQKQQQQQEQKASTPSLSPAATVKELPVVKEEVKSSKEKKKQHSTKFEEEPHSKKKQKKAAPIASGVRPKGVPADNLTNRDFSMGTHYYGPIPFESSTTSHESQLRELRERRVPKRLLEYEARLPSQPQHLPQVAERYPDQVEEPPTSSVMVSSRHSFAGASTLPLQAPHLMTRTTTETFSYPGGLPAEPY